MQAVRQLWHAARPDRMGGPGRRAFLPASAPRRLGIRLRHRSGAFKKRRKPGVLYSICSCAYLLQAGAIGRVRAAGTDGRSEEHTSELQSLMRISYVVFVLQIKHVASLNLTS